MLANLGNELFPDECTVLEIVPSHHYVFPIFKNGSSSLAKSGFRTIACGELQNLQVVDIFVRDPLPRFFSGVQTFLSKIDKNLDKHTILWMIEHYLFFNRHFCPQMYWLLNFRRFSNARLRVRPIAELSELVPLHLNSSELDSEIVDFFEQGSSKYKFFLEMDEVLTVNFINQTVDYEQLMQTLWSNYGSLYLDTFEKLKQINVVVPETRSFR